MDGGVNALFPEIVKAKKECIATTYIYGFEKLF